MKSIYFLLVFFSNIVNSESIYLKGSFDFIDGKSILLLSLKNSSKKSFCLQDWHFPESEFPITIFSNEFIIRGRDNNFIEYTGPILMPSNISKSYRYFILSPGSEIKQKINLSDTYLFFPGKYRLSYFKSVVDCKALSYEQMTLESSIALKSIYLNNHTDFKTLNQKVDGFNSKVWNKYGIILEIDSLEFEIPQSQ